MRTPFDFSPMFRSSVGFDRVFDLLESAGRAQPENWPPYNIEKAGENQYRIMMVVPGYLSREITVTAEPNLLIVRGEKPEEEDKRYLYRGIANGPFERRYELADHVTVAGAALHNGILTVDLAREIPEAMKPRTIEIGTGAPHGAEKNKIEQKKHAA